MSGAPCFDRVGCDRAGEADKKLYYSLSQLRTGAKTSRLLIENGHAYRDDHTPSGAGSVQFFAIVRHGIEKRPDLTIEELDIRRNSATR